MCITICFVHSVPMNRFFHSSKEYSSRRCAWVCVHGIAKGFWRDACNWFLFQFNHCYNVLQLPVGIDSNIYLLFRPINRQLTLLSPSSTHKHTHTHNTVYFAYGFFFIPWYMKIVKNFCLFMWNNSALWSITNLSLYSIVK